MQQVISEDATMSATDNLLNHNLMNSPLPSKWLTWPHGVSDMSHKWQKTVRTDIENLALLATVI